MRRRRRGHRSHLTVCALVLLPPLLLLSACMGDNASDDATTTPPSATAVVAPNGTTSPAPVVSSAASTPSGSAVADVTPTVNAPPSATPTLAATATATATAPVEPTATANISTTPVTSDDPVVQALLDAMPPLDLFPEDWVERIETQSDRGFTHGHCRMQPSMALNAHVVANGGELNVDDISDSMGPIVNGTYRLGPDDGSTEIGVSVMDLSAVPIADAGRVIVEYFLAEGSCETWEPEPGRVYTYSDVNPAFPMVGDNGLQWARAVHFSGPLGDSDGLAMVFAVGNRLVAISASAPDPATIPQALVEAVAQSIAASLSGTAFEPERRALLDALSAAGAEFPMEWTPQERQVTAYPDDGLPHHCGLDLPLPVPVPGGADDAVTELRVTTEYAAMSGEPSTNVLLTLMHLPTAADARAVVAFHQSEVSCNTWTADPQQGIEVTYAPVEVVVPRLGDEPLWARAITATSPEGERQGIALVYAVENRVVFLISLAPVAEPIPAYVLETLTWKLTEALRRVPATT